jgi:hypothetical protein
MSVNELQGMANMIDFLILMALVIWIFSLNYRLNKHIKAEHPLAYAYIPGPSNNMRRSLRTANALMDAKKSFLEARTVFKFYLYSTSVYGQRDRDLMRTFKDNLKAAYKRMRAMRKAVDNGLF